MRKYVILFLSIGFLFANCSKEDDDVSSGPNPTANAEVDVQNFMWKAMNIWYFWQDEVPVLADDRFTTSEAYTAYLQEFQNPRDFYNNELKFSQDRFSFLNEDYKVLVQNFAGVSKSNGVEFGLVRFSDSTNVHGFVRYIIPNSNASGKEIKRGDIFSGVNGQTLTLSNYIELLFGSNDTYTLNMSDIIDGVPTPNGKEVVLTKENNLVENPVFLTKTFDIAGNKIGYLMYNAFTRNFDEQLNNAFGQLNAEGVTDLVLDLR